jgi:hypothetical protein
MSLTVMNVSAKGNVTPDNRVEMKLLEISKVVKLSAIQRGIISRAYSKFIALTDSSLYKVSDANASIRINYNATREFHEKFMNTLTEVQRIAYIKCVSAPEVEAKTQYRISLLKSTNNYSDSELEGKKKEIYDYLMLEKIVYTKDRYDYAKQKNNISRLKSIQPTSLKESLNVEKQRGLGKLRSGNILW